jgi:hypothetical protein
MIVENALKEAIIAMSNPNPESCAKAISMCIEALKDIKWDEERIDVIGQNGNTGEHYLS